MEQLHHQNGGTHEVRPPEPTPDELAIYTGIEAARAEEREIDDATARRIAAQLHGGQASAVYSLASTGHIDEEQVYRELAGEYEQQRDPEVREWINWLGGYCLRRADKGPVPDWHRTTDDDADEAQAHTNLMQRLNAAAVTTLGQVATIMTAEGVHGFDADDQADVDTFPWRDAARWCPDLDEDLDQDQARSADEILDLLFRQSPDAEFGAQDDMGWCGTVRYQGRPGGAVLRQNRYGRRWAVTTDSDDELAELWEQAERERDAYRYAAQRQAPGGVDDGPQIWVASLADYTAGYLHGAWLDAALEPDELTDAVQYILRNSHDPDAEEHGIFDYDGFGHDVANLLGEYPSFETVSRIARGIAEHGQAFAAWAAYVGPDQGEQLDRFEDHYLGEWDSVEAYAEHLLEESEAYRVVEEAPEWLRPYLKIDAESYARDLAIELYVAESDSTTRWIFDTRT